MLAALSTLAWQSPTIDYHAFAPEIILVAGTLLVVVLDSVLLERARAIVSAVSGAVLLGATAPLISLAVSDHATRSMFGGAYVVDRFALITKAIFLLSAYLVVLLSTNYVAEGDYWESEYYTMLMSSVLGMTLMASARDLLTIFVALELLSIPAYMLATWRKRDLKSNEAGLKYYLMGVFASAIMLYGMSLLFGETGTTLLTDIGAKIGAGETNPVVTLGIVFVITGFAFKISAFPFHTWAPDTYEGAPTPVSAFLAVASKAAGFVALLQLVYVGFLGRSDVFEPLMWILAVGSMTYGNLVALRQTNVVRLLAYSGIAQAGYMLAPLVVIGHSQQVADDGLRAIVTYLAIYAAMNLGAFGVVIALARKTRSAELDSLRGSFQYAPGLTVAMTVFLMSLAGIPIFGGWFAKLEIIDVLVSPKTPAGIVMAVIIAVNSVIALFYYAGIARRMWADPVPDGDLTPVRVPVSMTAAISIAAIIVIVFGAFPGVISHVTDVTLAAPF
jgi:NADH-quinone oxidoreductase subunit N